MSICTTGGQGCVIYPEMDCTDPSQNHTSRNKYVSKIQSDSNTMYEYSIITYLKKIIPTYVPDYEKYTVLQNITKCYPSNSQKEVHKICPKCTIPYKDNSVVSMLNIPYKGIAFDKILFPTTPYIVPGFWKAKRYTTLTQIYDKAIQYYTHPSISPNTIRKYLSNPDIIEYIHIEYSFKTINTKLLDIFTKLIKEINTLGIYHSDLKASNILIDLPPNPTKYDLHNAPLYVIDWGITNLTTNSVININKPLYVPLLCPAFMGYYNKYSNTSPIDTIVYTYFTANPITVTSHVAILNDALDILTGISEGYICGLHPKWFYHMVDWLKYIKTHKYTFDYIKSVAMYNKDTVGMISIYVTIYLAIYYHYVIPSQALNPPKNTDEKNIEPLYTFYQQLGKLCLHILTNTYTEIKHNDVIKYLLKLNDLLKISW
jgi:hypothetical protein